MLDGDQTYKPQEILRLIEPLESNFSKVVIGSRIHGRMREGSMKLLNRLGNYAFSAMVKLTYRVQVTDVLTGYFAWSREVIEQLRPCLTADGFAIEMEMITKMAKLGHEIYSVPITYDARAGESNLHPFSDGSRILSMYLRSLMWRAPKPKAVPPPASCASKQQDYVSDDV
jgi:dolichol-phosphate mannosyltransferase